jgi:SAM-dependent methyltransferase
MTPEEIAKSYDALASHWNGPDFNRNNGIAQHERALQFVKTKGTAIDIGCGSSGRIIELLLSNGHETEGLDISPEMLRLAKARHPGRTFHLANIYTWDFPHQYDYISAWDSIWHAPLAQHEAILKKLCGGLRNGGVLIFTTGGVDSPEERTNPCMGQPLYHAALGIPAILNIVSDAGCICRHLEYDQFPELHVYLVVQRVA